MTGPTLGAVVIGRNEGDRLKASLRSLLPHCARVVYVDSGSADASVAFARGLGVTVVELDRSVPFTAARARNAGAEALLAAGEVDLIQFVDGDCAVDPGWLPAGRDALAADATLGLVTGWRSEIHPTASVYNAMCEVDWHRPAGVIRTCGGDMMVRAEAFRAVGGFDPTVIAAEDDEFCLRLGKAGWGLRRLPLPMTRHDADMHRFGQWWSRSKRSGHGYAQVGAMHPPHFARQQRQTWLYGLVLPVLLGVGLLVSGWLVLAVVAVYALSFARTWSGLRGHPMAVRQAGLLTLSKLPGLIGMLTYLRRRRRGAAMNIIEYK